MSNESQLSNGSRTSITADDMGSAMIVTRKYGEQLVPVQYEKTGLTMDQMADILKTIQNEDWNNFPEAPQAPVDEMIFKEFSEKGDPEVERLVVLKRGRKLNHTYKYFLEKGAIEGEKKGGFSHQPGKKMTDMFLRSRKLKSRPLPRWMK